MASMGVELIWIIGLEAEDDVTLRMDHEGIAAHGNGGEGSVIGVSACVLVGADDGLEVVAMEMEGVLAWIVTV